MDGVWGRLIWRGEPHLPGLSAPGANVHADGAALGGTGRAEVGESSLLLWATLGLQRRQYPQSEYVGHSFLEHIADSNRLFSESGAMIAYDRTRGRIIAAVDRFCTVPLYFREEDDGVAIASGLPLLSVLSSGAFDIRQQGIFDYLYFHVVPAPETVFAGVKRLLPGQVLYAGTGGVSIETAWRPEFRVNRQLSREDAGASLRQRLDDAVSRLSEARAVGTFLSGGTDSTSITSTLSTVRAVPAKAFSIGFDEPGYDETEYARIAAKACGAEHHEYFVTPDDVVEAVPRIAASMDQPFGNASVVPAYYCALLARDHGVDLMLGGDGGDELFGGNERYQKQLLFALYDGLPRWLRLGLLEPGSALMPPLPLLRKVKSYINQARMGMPARMESYNLLGRIGPSNILTAAFLENVSRDQPLSLIEHVYRNVHADGVINRMLGRDFQFTLADDDLVKVRGACRLAGVDVAFPFLDDAIVDLSLTLPEDWKVTRKALRPFFKEALSDRLPPEVIGKQKHGFGLPFGVWLSKHRGLRRLASDSLESLAERGIVRKAFLTELLSARLDEHGAYYGTLVWVLMMLEQWLQAQSSAVGQHGGRMRLDVSGA